MGERFEVLKEKVDVKGHINFIKNLLQRHEWNEAKKRELLSNLEVIEKKYYDKKFYMAIIGEFSSGKSSFINAIIRDDLLKRDVIQATTSTATNICYGKNMDVIITFQDGIIKTYRKNGIPFFRRLLNFIVKPPLEIQKKNIRDFIHNVTAEENIAQYISEVKIDHFSETLKDGLVIIDTPGVNANNHRHAEVSQNVLKNVADGGIVVIPSNIPLAQSLVEFLHEHLSGLIHRCIFVVTKMDLLKPKEREMVLKNIKKRLEKEFDIKPFVLPYTPILILHKFANGYEEVEIKDIKEVDYKNLIEESINTETLIQNKLYENRIIIQIEKLLTVISEMYQNLKTDMETMEQNYMEQHKTILGNMMTDLTFFITEKKTEYVNLLIEKNSNIEQETIEKLDTIKQNALNRLETMISSSSSYSKIVFNINQNNHLMMKDSEETMYKVFNLIKSNAQEQVTLFEEEFEKKYNSLSSLQGYITIDEKKFTKETTSLVHRNIDNRIAQVRNKIAGEQIKDYFIIGFLIGIFSVIGSFLFPCVGTLLGGILGGIICFFLITPFVKKKKIFYEKSKEALNEAFKDILAKSVITIREAIESSNNDLNSIMDIYLTRYNKLVNEIRENDKTQADTLEQKREIILKDMEELNRQNEKLIELRNKTREDSMGKEQE